MVVWESRTSRWCVHNRDDPDVTVNVGLVDLVRYSQPGWFSDEYARSWNMIISLLHCCVSALGTNSLITSWRTNGPDVRLCVGNTWKIRDKDKRSTTVTAKSWIRIPRIVCHFSLPAGGWIATNVWSHQCGSNADHATLTWDRTAFFSLKGNG